MATLRPPSSPSPSPLTTENGRAPANSRASMGPRQTLSPASPRPGGGGISGTRPTSELLGSASMFQTPESDAIDQWFENLQNYEATLEDMAAASLDVNFKEELSAIEQWFKVLSEAERTAALYSLLQHSTQVQIRFFITVLQQMARSDPMTALLSPAVGGSMQSQMEAKLAQMSLKSPALKSPMPSSPRNFSANRQSLALDTSSAFLSPESAAIGAGGNDAAATLAQQRAKLKASNAAHRISAPVLASTGGDGRTSWGSALSQVAEQNPHSPAQEIAVPSPNISVNSRPKSTEFSGSIGSPHPGADTLSPIMGDSWASMVNTPQNLMFGKETHGNQNLDAAAAKLNEWSALAAAPRVPLMADPKSFRRASKGNTAPNSDNGRDGNSSADNSLIQQQQQQQQQAQRRNVSQGSNTNFNGQQQGAWNGARSPGLPTPNRFGDEANSLNGLGMAGFNMGGLGSPGLNMGMQNAGLLAGMNPLQQMNMLNMQAQMSAMGISPEQVIAAQMAAGFTQPGWLGLPQAMQGGNGGNNSNSNNRNRGGGGGRSPGLGKSGSSAGSNAGSNAGGKKDEEDVDPALLNDIPAWLRSLRLHKYTPNFEGYKWQDMVMLDEAALEAKGVAALGARRKMLKTFEVVRKKMGMENPSGASETSSS